MDKTSRKIIDLYKRSVALKRKSGLPLHVNQTSLAKRVGVSPSVVSRVLALAKARGEL